VYVLNFYSPVFADQLRRGRKSATIRLGDKTHKYRRGEAVLVTVGFQHAAREKIFLSPRDVEHDNPEFRRIEETQHFLEQIYGRPVELEDEVTVVRFSAIHERPSEIAERFWAEGPMQN
jgi:hypothetical protein